VLPDFLRSSGFGTGPTQPLEYNFCLFVLNPIFEELSERK
jgi:hypothetical protein